MTRKLCLFARPPAQRHSPTSVQAAEAIEPHTDPCANKHGGDAESRAAFRSGNKQKDIEIVFQFVRSCGARGATLDECCQALGKDPNQISGRFTDLKKSKRIFASELRRDTKRGCKAKVYVVSHALPETQKAA